MKSGYIYPERQKAVIAYLTTQELGRNQGDSKDQGGVQCPLDIYSRIKDGTDGRVTQNSRGQEGGAVPFVIGLSDQKGL